MTSSFAFSKSLIEKILPRQEKRLIPHFPFFSLIYSVPLPVEGVTTLSLLGHVGHYRMGAVVALRDVIGLIGRGCGMVEALFDFTARTYDMKRWGS